MNPREEDNMKKREDLELTIEKMIFPNIGIAFYEDMEVHVKNALPGQKILAKIGKIKENYAEARLLEVLSHRDDEIAAECIHDDFRGGCARQNLLYGQQLKEKEMAVLNLFQEHGFRDIPYEGITPSPRILRYRNKMEYTFGDMEKG